MLTESERGAKAFDDLLSALVRVQLYCGALGRPAQGPSVPATNRFVQLVEGALEECTDADTGWDGVTRDVLRLVLQEAKKLLPPAPDPDPPVARAGPHEVVSPPLYTHDCTNCRYLGAYDEISEIPPVRYDLYHCGGSGPFRSTIIARFGNEGSEYQSGLVSGRTGTIPALAEAYRRAKVLGLNVDERPSGS